MDKRHSAATHFMLHRRRQFIHSLMKESYKISGRSRKKLDNERRRAIKEIVLDMVKRKFPNTTLTTDGVDKEFKKYDLKQKDGKLPSEWEEMDEKEKAEIELCYAQLNRKLSSLDCFNVETADEICSPINSRRTSSIEHRHQPGHQPGHTTSHKPSSIISIDMDSEETMDSSLTSPLPSMETETSSTSCSSTTNRRLPMGTHFMLHKRRQFIHSLMKVSYKISAKSRSKDDNERRRTIKETVLRLVREKYPGTTLTIDGVDKEYKKYEAKRQGHGHLRNIPDEWLALTEEEKKELQQAIRLIDEEVAKLPSINLPSPSEERRPFVRSIDGDHSNGEVNLNDEEDEDIAPDPEFDEEHWRMKEVLIELRQNDQKTSYFREELLTVSASLPSSPIITVPPPLPPTMLNARHVSVIRSTSTAF